MTGVPRARATLAWLLPWLVAAGLALFSYVNVVVRMPPLQADEAGHALPGARMALALRAGDLAGFTTATRDEVHWPFVHPWLLCAAFLAFGIKSEVARGLSLVALAVVLGLLPLLARELADQDAPPWLGWLAITVLLVTPDCWMFASQVMSESLGMLWTVLALWLGARATARARPRLQAAAGGLAALAFLTKYNYGAPLALALAGAPLLRGGRKGLRQSLAVVLGFGLPVALWLGWQLSTDFSRRELILGVVANRDEGLRGVEGLAFYPRALAARAGLAVAVVAALGLASSAWRRPRGPRLAALLFGALTLALLTWHPNKQWRYALPLLPVALVLADVEVAARLSRWRRDAGPAYAAAALLLLVTRAPLEALLDTVRSGEVPGAAARVVGFAADQTGSCGTVLVLGSTGLLPHSAIEWDLLRRGGHEPRVRPLGYPDERAWDPRYRLGYPSELTPPFTRALERTLSEERPDCVVSLELSRDSPFLPDWLARWDAWGQNYVRLMLRQPGFEVSAERRCPTEAAVVRVHRPRTRP